MLEVCATSGGGLRVDRKRPLDDDADDDDDDNDYDDDDDDYEVEDPWADLGGIRGGKKRTRKHLSKNKRNSRKRRKTRRV